MTRKTCNIVIISKIYMRTDFYECTHLYISIYINKYICYQKILYFLTPSLILKNESILEDIKAYVIRWKEILTSIPQERRTELYDRDLI